MKNHKSNHNTLLKSNLLGKESFQSFLKSHADLRIALRGGSCPRIIALHELNTLVKDVNLLTLVERKHLIFSSNLFNN